MGGHVLQRFACVLATSVSIKCGACSFDHSSAADQGSTGRACESARDCGYRWGDDQVSTRDTRAIQGGHVMAVHGNATASQHNNNTHRLCHLYGGHAGFRTCNGFCSSGMLAKESPLVRAWKAQARRRLVQRTEGRWRAACIHPPEEG